MTTWPPPSQSLPQRSQAIGPTLIAVTGASGSILALKLAQILLENHLPVAMIFSEKSLQVLFEETGLKLTGKTPQEKARHLLEALALESVDDSLLSLYGNHEIGAPPASGTHLTQGMVILPCSMGTLGRIACGLSDNLLTRAADVTLKERRRLIIVPRESPFSTLHLRNMTTLSELGALIIPPVLSFYLPEFNSLDGQIHYTLGKILDHLGFGHQLHRRWGEKAKEPFI